MPTPAVTTAIDSERERVIAALSALSLPMMWSLRQRAMQTYEPLGVRPTRVLLMELVERGIDQPKLVAEVLEATPPAITAVVNELIERDWMARGVDPSDRRRVRLHLTAAGHEALATFRQRWIDTSRADLEQIDVADLTVVLRVFQRLLERRP